MAEDLEDIAENAIDFDYASRAPSYEGGMLTKAYLGARKILINGFNIIRHPKQLYSWFKDEYANLTGDDFPFP